MAIGLGIAFVIVIGTYLLLENKIDGQRQRNQILTDEIARYDRQIKEIQRLKKVKDALIARMNIIQQLQENRPMLVHFFDEIIKILPKGVHFTKITRQGDEVSLTGQSDSNTEVSQLMRNIESNYWLHQPRLEEIKEVKEFTRNRKTLIFDEFRLKAILKSKHSMQMNL
jgi:type IV pilus assembly protein PilN